MRHFRSKSRQSEKTKMITLEQNKRTEFYKVLILIVIAAITFIFVKLSISHNNLFLKEILISGSIIGLLGINTFISQNKSKQLIFLNK